MKRLKVILTLMALLFGNTFSFAQCAMCKTTIVNNVSHGELALAEGLNFGIMYLFFAPYIIFMVIGGIFAYQYWSHKKKLHV